MPDEAIVFYDGNCGFCHRMVRVALYLDTRHRLRFSPLQGQTAKRYLTDIQRQRLDRIIFRYNHRLYEKSTAIIKLLHAIGGLWVVASIALLIPRVIRESLYDCMATRRYTLFGTVTSCTRPSPKHAAQFLD